MGLFRKTVTWLSGGSSAQFGLTDTWAGRLFSGNQPSYSGKTVTVDTALQLSVVWACVRLLARTISTLPLVLYSTDPKGNSVEAKSNPLYEILRYRPNADMTAVEFWEAMVASVLLTGNAYALISRNAVKQVVSLLPLRADWVTVRIAADGSSEYLFRGQVYPSEDIFHLKGFGTSGRVGLSVISYARHSLGTAIAADEAAGRTFANGMAVNGALSTDQKLDKDQRTRLKEGMKEYRGSENSGKLLVLEAGLKYAPIALNPDDAQLLQTRQFHVEDLCRWFDVDPSLIGHGANSKSVTLEDRQIAFYIHALRPWCTKIEQAIRYSLLLPAERVTNNVEFNIADILRGDSAARAALYSAYTQNGIMSRNQVRALENLPADDNPEADELTVQSNLILVKDLGKQPAAQTPAGFGIPKPAGEGGPKQTDPAAPVKQ